MVEKRLRLVLQLAETRKMLADAQLALRELDYAMITGASWKTATRVREKHESAFRNARAATAKSLRGEI